MSIIEHDKFTLKEIEPNFLSLEIKEGKTIEAEDIHAIYSGYETLAGENEYVVAMYGNAFSSISKDAREIATSQYASAKRKKVALISDNLSHVILVTFFIKLNGPKTNIKIYKNEANAFSWLRSARE
jgi:hypothetical protein